MASGAALKTSWRQRAATVTGLALLVGGLMACKPWAQAPVDPSARVLQALQARCESDMLRRACRVANGPSASPVTQPGDLVFVAGIGAIDARVYAELQSAGAAMCDTVVAACREDLAGPRCAASRALFGEAKAAP